MQSNVIPYDSLTALLFLVLGRLHRQYYNECSTLVFALLHVVLHVKANEIFQNRLRSHIIPKFYRDIKENIHHSNPNKPYYRVVETVGCSMSICRTLILVIIKINPAKLRTINNVPGAIILLIQSSLTHKNEYTKQETKNNKLQNIMILILILTQLEEHKHKKKTEHSYRS